MTENKIVKQLHGIASKLTDDLELQKDLMQEMFVHLVRVHSPEAGHTSSWYMKSCEFHARNYLRLGRSIDSIKRARNGVPYDETSADDGESSSNGAHPVPPVAQIEIHGEIITSDIINLIVPHLSGTQQRILFLLLKGCGVRETAREIGITHPAVIKHRRKIARVASELLHEPAICGSSGGTNGANTVHKVGQP